jgi:type III secretory pathway component EscT
MKFLYKNRASYYNEPEKLAKRQRVIRDSIILMVAGAIVGAIIGFFFSDIFY